MHGNRWYNNKQLSIFLNPTYPFYPKCIIEFTEPDKEWLQSLSDLLPGLKVSQVEYALDIYCRNWRATKLVWSLLIKYIHVLYKRSYKIKSGSSEEQLKNMVYFADTFKIYTRGEDNRKQIIGWLETEANRVRIEIKADRKYILRKNGILTLNDLITSPNFERMFDNIIKFKTFKQSRKQGISESEFYTMKNESNISIPFNQMFSKMKGKVSNIYTITTEPSGFIDIEKQLKYHMKKFDLNWSKVNPNRETSIVYGESIS